MNGSRKGMEVQIPVVSPKVEEDSVAVGGGAMNPRRMDVVHVVLRVLSLFAAVVSISAMAVAKQSSTLYVYGFSLPVYGKWTFAQSFEYLLGMSAAAAVHALIQLILSAPRLARATPVIASRRHAWLLFAGDQVFAYAMISAGSASSGVTNLNRTGIRHSQLPDFCKPLNVFCDRVAVSVAFAFLAFFLIAASAVLDVIWLSKY